MKKIIGLIILLLSLNACNDFLDNPPTTGLSEDKITDLPSMQALLYGAYDIARNFTPYGAINSVPMVRDAVVRNNSNYTQYYDHQLYNDQGMFNYAYQILGLINRIAISDVDIMEGTVEEKEIVLGDMHFLRAMVYFELNNYFTLPSTGYSIPLIVTPIGVNDRVSCSKSADIRVLIEEDIEKARTYFKQKSGISNYYAATALAARIYFFHDKYELAYERANEVINDNKYLLEDDLLEAFVPKTNSIENIFTLKYNSLDPISPAERIYKMYIKSETQVVYILNKDGEVAQLMQEDLTDKRWGFYEKEGDIIYINGKYSTDQMDYLYIRLPEIYLTRAEANIMNRNAVTQQDVDDINKIVKRAYPEKVLNSIPSKQEALSILYRERTKELAFELGDHYLNLKRLKKGIIKIPTEGTGLKSYDEYKDILAFPLPTDEIKIHGLTRNP